MDLRKVFEQGTIIRCNRCNASGPAPQEFKAQKTNWNGWRMVDTMIHPWCDHLDSHWVFDSDFPLEERQ